MDFSSLSNEELLALKAGDYSKLSNESLKVLKMQSGPTAQQQSVQGNWEGINQVPLAVPEQAPAQGLAALGELAGGRGLEQASAVAQGAEPTTTPGAIGKGVGDYVKPSDIVGMAMLPGGPQKAVEGAGAATEGIMGGVKDATQALISKMRNVITTLKGPGKEEAQMALEKAIAEFNNPAQAKAAQFAEQQIAPAQEAVTGIRKQLTSIPEQFRQKTALAKEVMGTAKKGLNEAEAGMGISSKVDPAFEATVRDPKKMAKVISALEPITSKGAENVNQQMTPSSIQLYRKMLQEGRGLNSGIAEASLEKSRATLTEALEQSNTHFASMRKNYLEIKNVMDELPIQQKKLTEVTRGRLVKASAELKDIQSQMSELRKAAKEADVAELNDISAKGMKLIQQAAQKEAILNKLKYIGYGAAGAAGYKTIKGAF